jgi:hypothetical protein
MDMPEETWRGNLAATPLPQILFRIWEKRESGRLRIQGDGIEKSICLVKGDPALVEGYYSGVLFLKNLLSSRTLTALQADECESYARETKTSYPRVLIEREIIPSSRVWESLAQFWLEELFALFDWPRADLTFDPGLTVSESRIYATFPAPKIIMQGIRRMKNSSLIEESLPPETESLQLLSPAHSDHLQLEPLEKHVLGILRKSPRLGDLYALSQAGKRETQKTVFAFLSLGLAGHFPASGPTKTPPELSSSGLEKIWSGFNDKCAFIHKYISKEIGPVGQSVLEKALEEVRVRLAPPYRGLELRADGRVEFDSFPVMSLTQCNEETRKNFIRLLNEVLVAEVLAVKRALGNAHEAAVVRNLEKIGEPS